MKLRMTKHMIKQGFVGMWRNRMMSLASIGAVTSSLMILGIILILILNINNVANVMKAEIDEIHIFLEEDISSEQVDKLHEDISMIDGISSVVFQSKDKALESMKQEWGEEGYLLEGLEVNPLPSAYIIQLEDIRYTDGVVNQLQGRTGIEEIKYSQDIVEKMMGATQAIKIGGLVLIGILILVAIFTISNTIKLTVTARKTEITIMKYVGATNGFIRGPFIIEGMLLGLLGSGVAIAIINYGYKHLFNAASDKLYVLFTTYMLPYTRLTNDIVIIFVAIGVGVGILGSVISLKRFLNV